MSCLFTVGQFFPEEVNSITCESEEYVNVCKIDTGCPSCADIIQRFKDCAVPDCPSCTELGITSAPIDPNNPPTIPLFTFPPFTFPPDAGTYEDDDDISPECQVFAIEYQICLQNNLDCFFSPECVEAGIADEDNAMNDEFTCELVPEGCKIASCCEPCAEIAKKLFHCEANERGCTERCGDENATIPTAPVSPAPITPAPTMPALVTLFPTASIPALVTLLPTASIPALVSPAPTTPVPTMPAIVTPFPTAPITVTPSSTMSDQPVTQPSIAPVPEEEDDEGDKQTFVEAFNDIDEGWVKNIVIGSCAVAGALILFIVIRSCYVGSRR